MAWATTDDVSTITGITVTSAQLAQAHGVVELHAGRTQDQPTDTMRARDLGWLKRAVCWQAVWQKEQAGYTTRVSATRIAQDGVDVTLGPAGGELAPLAARALRNLSWKGTRSIRVAHPGRALAHPDLIDYASDYSDGTHRWTPL